MIATLVNSIAIVAGGLIGLLAKKGLPERVSKGIMTAIGLMLICTGVKGYFDGNSTIVAILSLALGTGLGELLRLEERLNRLGEHIGARVSRNGGSRVGEGLVTATLLFCVGAMAVLGARKAASQATIPRFTPNPSSTSFLRFCSPQPMASALRFPQ